SPYLFSLALHTPPRRSTLFPYTTLFRSSGNRNQQLLEPIGLRLTGSPSREAAQNLLRHYEAGRTCAMKLPKKPLKAPTVHAGLTPQNWASFMRPRTLPAILLSPRTVSAMHTNKPKVSLQRCFTSYHLPWARHGTKNLNRSVRRQMVPISAGYTV